MSAPRRPMAGWGPTARRAAVCLTFDNLGEAAELELGIWPDDAPLGEHPSLVSGLPWVLAQLPKGCATFFIEGWSAARYPNAVRSIMTAGHEVGLHGWRHESWARLASDTREAELLARGCDTIAGFGVPAVGFRAPGGPETRHTPRLLEPLGFAYSSPLGIAPGVVGNLVYLPYQWRAVDAFSYEPLLGGLRQANGAPEPPFSPAEVASTIDTMISKAIEKGELLVLVWHAHLLVDDDRRQVFAGVLDRLLHDDRIWLAGCRDVAGCLLADPHTRKLQPELATGGW